MRHPKPLAPPRPLAALALSGLLCAAAPALAGVPQRKRPPQKPAPTKAEPPKAQPSPTPAPTATQNGQPQAKEVAPSSMLIRWQGRPGVNRYRLQVARDLNFEDIVFDQAVEGRQHVVKGLAPGNYFWRVAAAAAETSSYSRPEPITLGTTARTVEVSNVVVPVDAGGWRTATGEVARLVPGRLRTGAVVDFVGVGPDGRVFAVDGASGISLWTARFAADATVKGTAFEPLVLEGAGPEASVVAATDGGVRALRGETGREAWRARLEGRPASGTAADVNGDGKPEAVVVTADPHRIYVLDAGTGAVMASDNLGAEMVGAPYAYRSGAGRGLAMAFRDGTIAVRGADLKVVTESKLGDEITTAPLVFTRGADALMVLGTDKGLAALNVADLKMLGRISADDDMPRGPLSAADVDGDGSQEIVMLTKRGRMALVGTGDGAVRWFVEGLNDAASATFADVDADGILDVLVPGGPAFALGFSGRDGKLIYKVEEGRSSEQKSGAAPRTLVAAPSPSGGGILVGSDPSRQSLRAVELPRGSIRASSVVN
ncbi:MAG TPA: FG-GAP-like repeat-containing protein [Pyrinomonadaceae bacterium]|jgi:outer membrane protein assembly factor BamB|nr:FG-GAP-like repeat-containing protein [Pyrinomonadaceae bacterium]